MRAGARVVEGEVAVGHAPTRFDDKGRLEDESLREQFAGDARRAPCRSRGEGARTGLTDLARGSSFVSVSDEAGRRQHVRRRVRGLAKLLARSARAGSPKAMLHELVNGFRLALLSRHPATKTEAELAFWKSRLEIDNGHFHNWHYERLMLGMAGEPNAEFFRLRKLLRIFGCGPRGSLVWASPARLRIGIDVLVVLLRR